MRSIYHRSFGYWPSIIPTIMVRDVDRRFRASRMSGLLLVLEPLALIAAVGALQYVLRNGLPIYGPSMALFLVTGFLPFYMFVHSARGLSRDVSNEREFPIVNDLDLQIARLLIEILRNIFIAVVMLSFIYVFDTTYAYPYDLAPIVMALAVLTSLAMGLGLFTSAIVTVFPAFGYVNGLISRAFFFGSGVFTMIDHYPPHIRDITLWNPLAHCLIWIRTGFYRDYPTTFLDRAYAVEVGMVFLFVGFVAFAARPQQN